MKCYYDVIYGLKLHVKDEYREKIINEKQYSKNYFEYVDKENTLIGNYNNPNFFLTNYYFGITIKTFEDTSGNGIGLLPVSDLANLLNDKIKDKFMKKFKKLPVEIQREFENLEPKLYIGFYDN